MGGYWVQQGLSTLMGINACQNPGYQIEKL